MHNLRLHAVDNFDILRVFDVRRADLPRTHITGWYVE